MVKADYWDFTDVAIGVYENKPLEIEKLINAIYGEPKKREIREYASRTLMAIAKCEPTWLYSYWDRFGTLLESDNGFSKLVALHVLADLSRIDYDRKIHRTIYQFLGCLDDNSIMVALHTAQCAGAVAQALPELGIDITKALLNIWQTHHDRERQDRLAGSCLLGVASYFNQLNELEQKDIVAFAVRCLQSISPGTRKHAKDFLRRIDQ